MCCGSHCIRCTMKSEGGGDIHGVGTGTGCLYVARNMEFSHGESERVRPQKKRASDSSNQLPEGDVLVMEQRCTCRRDPIKKEGRRQIPFENEFHGTDVTSVDYSKSEAGCPTADFCYDPVVIDLKKCELCTAGNSRRDQHSQAQPAARSVKAFLHRLQHITFIPI
mmetsp:Transcript_10601/g.65385  ORF Transcript_10601/g.65385 Transcript_10601/m.65385 type:complete len:166 (+) Transcript_10601:2401-2898(+)